MTIYGATRYALIRGGWIARPWGEMGAMLCVKPTNTQDCCKAVILAPDGKLRNHPARCWNPKADDLVATDWRIIKKRKLLKEIGDERGNAL